MNLKNPELFRSWLIRQLEPICKANPEPVSKYVCALLKKEKTDGELKESLISQLDIFLDSATEEFVNFLIEVLESEKYLTNDADFQPSEALRCEKEDEVKIDTSIELELDLLDNPAPTAAEPTPAPAQPPQRKSPSPIQAPTPSPPRTRPPPPQFQRTFSPRPLRRNRFRNERRRIANRRSRRDTSSHSDSPLPERRPNTRKRSVSASSESSTKSPRRSWIAASRSSDAANKKYKHRNFASSTRSPPPGPRSRSVSPRIRKRKPSSATFRKRTRPADSRSNSDDDRGRGGGVGGGGGPKRLPIFQSELLRAVNSDLPHVNSAEPPPPPPPTSFSGKQRCSDFEGKGYCARGDMCPFDHGPSPIVLDNSLLNGIVPLPPHPPNFQDANMYTPQFVNTNFLNKAFRPDNQMPPLPNRELIAVPTLPLPQKPENKAKLHGGKPSYGHIFSSLPPGVSQTTIELSNVPTELNTIPNLYEKFSVYGNITLIQAKRNSDANTALLTFTNATEAALAFINLDTVIPNAKAAWYADKCIMKPFPRKSIPTSGNANAKTFALKRGVAAAANANTNEKVAAPPTKKPGGTPVKSAAEPSSHPARKVSSMVPATATADGKPKTQTPEVRKQDPGRLLSDLIKKKKDLLEKQLASRKQIEDKIRALDKGSKEQKTWTEMLKKLNDVISENQNSLQTSLLQRKEYLQKMNIVPMDSATINSMKQESNTNTRTRQVKLTPAPASSSSSSAAAKITVPPSNSSSVTTSKHDDSAAAADFFNSSNESDQIDDSIFEIDVDSSILNQEFENESLDRREKSPLATPVKISSQSDASKTEKAAPPVMTDYTRVVVTGFENGDEDELIQHFSQFGNIVDKEIDKTIPQATLIYDNRKSADQAKKEGRNFQDRLLSVTVFGGKKFQPLVRRTTTFKAQDFSSYTASFGGGGGPGGGGANPYKYKKAAKASTPAATSAAAPGAGSTPPATRASSRNVYSYRADAKSRAVVKTAGGGGGGGVGSGGGGGGGGESRAAENNGIKLTDDEDLITFLKKGGIDDKEVEKYMN